MSEMYTHIASTTGSTSSTGTQSITLSSIPQTYDDIELWFTYGAVYSGSASGQTENIGIQWSTSSGGTISMPSEWGWLEQYQAGSAYNLMYRHNTATPAKFNYAPYQSTSAINDNPNGSSYPQAKFSGVLRINNYSNISTMSTWHLLGATGEMSYAVTSSSAGTSARNVNNNGYFGSIPAAIHDLKFDSTFSTVKIFYWLSDLYGITGR